MVRCPPRDVSNLQCFPHYVLHGEMGSIKLLGRARLKHCRYRLWIDIAAGWVFTELWLPPAAAMASSGIKHLDSRL